jgi:hypothetical protein
VLARGRRASSVLPPARLLLCDLAWAVFFRGLRGANGSWVLPGTTTLRRRWRASDLAFSATAANAGANALDHLLHGLDLLANPVSTARRISATR